MEINDINHDHIITKATPAINPDDFGRVQRQPIATVLESLCVVCWNRNSSDFLCVALCLCLREACFYVDAKIKMRKEFVWLNWLFCITGKLKYSYFFCEVMFPDSLTDSRLA